MTIDSDGLADILSQIDPWASVQGRIPFMTEVLAGSPRKGSVFPRLNLDGSMRETAVRVIAVFGGYGQVKPDDTDLLRRLINNLLRHFGEGEEAGFLRGTLEHIEHPDEVTRPAEPERTGPLTNKLMDYLGGGDDADFLRDVLNKRQLPAVEAAGERAHTHLEEVVRSAESTRTRGQKPEAGKFRRPQRGLYVEICSPEAREKAFRQNQRRYKLFAQKLLVDHQIHSDGRVEVTYGVVGLQTKRRLRAFEHHIRTDGLIRNLPLDIDARREGMYWQLPDKLHENATPEEKIRELQDQNGKVCFNRDVAGPKDKLTFSIRYNIVNACAMSDRDFSLLYPPGKPQKNLADELLQGEEYMSTDVWFPVKQVEMKLHLPPTIRGNPRLDVFLNPGLEQKELVEEHGTLRKREAAERWKRDTSLRESDKRRWLHRGGNKSWELKLEYPPVGSAYAINWIVPKASQTILPDWLEAEAQSFCRRLMRCRESRRGQGSQPDELVDQVKKELAMLFDACHKQFPCGEGDEIFEVSLMSYDEGDKRIRVVEGDWREDPEIERLYFELALPPGVGNAGTCFKTGQIYMYVKGELSEQFSYYVPFGPPAKEHQVLISIPLDHPLFAATARDVFSRKESDKRSRLDGDSLRFDRRRQTVGVMNIGSTCASSFLRRLHSDEDDHRRLMSELESLCQNAVNRIWNLIPWRLPRVESSRPAFPDGLGKVDDLLQGGGGWKEHGSGMYSMEPSLRDIDLTKTTFGQ